MKHQKLLGISNEGFHEIAYTEWGSPSTSEPAVICVHGYSRNSRDFDALATYLRKQGKYVLCPDVVGRGESAWFNNSHNYQFTQYLNDMNALIARSQATEIDWIGTSMGGIIGMMLAALPNSPIHRLVLNDVGAQVPLYGLRRIAKYSSQNPRFRSLHEAKEYYKLNYSDFGLSTERQWDKLVKHSLRQEKANLFVSKMDPKINRHKSASEFLTEFFHHPHKALEGILYDIDLWPIWKEVQCPVLIIHGVHSDILTSDIIQAMRTIHPDTEVYPIDTAGHAPALLQKQDHEIIHHFLY